MQSHFHWALPSLLIVLSLTTLAVGDDGSPAASSEDSIAAVMERYVAAFNHRDVEALASQWRPQGEFVNHATGTRTLGREAIADNFRRLFSAHDNLSLGGRIESVRFIRPEVAQVTGVAITAGTGGEPLESTFTAIVVHDGHQWLFDSIHETPVTTEASAVDQLESLEFLVGQWIDDSDQAQVTTTYRWSANRSFMIRSFTVEQGDGDVSQGTQVIGWDPRRNLIRCWTFNSDGSFGEGTWTPTENGWNVKMTQTLADGRLAGATQAITRIDDNTLSVHLVGQEVAGETLPSSNPVRVIRVREQLSEN